MQTRYLCRTIRTIATNCCLALIGTVITSQAQVSCIQPPANLAGWWRGEGDTVDQASGNTGTPINSVSYGSGEVGRGFLLNGTNDYVQVPASASLDVGQGPGFTLEAWVMPNDTGNGHSIFEWRSPSISSLYGVHFWIGHPSHTPGYFFANIVDTSGGFHVIDTADGLVQSNLFQHVALTYDKSSGIARLYLNGSLITEANLGTFTPQTTFDLNLGARPETSWQSYPYGGILDEASIYSRALDPGEVWAIFTAGAAGKCSKSPWIAVQPTDQYAYVGDTVSLTASASGASPLAYVWYDSVGTVVPGGNSGVLTFTNVQLSQAGGYTMLASNEYGTAFSSQAVLNVTAASACTPPANGLIGLWRLDGNALDSVGTSHGALASGPTFEKGMVRGAVAFNGINQFIQIADAPALNPTLGLTVEAWVFLTSTATNRAMQVLAKDDGFLKRQFALSTVPSGTNVLANGYLRVGYSSLTLTGSKPLALEAWNHLAGVYDGSAWKLYVNGVLDTNTAASGLLPITTQPLQLGRNGAGSFLEGKLDEASLYGRGLTSAEIQAVWTARAGGKCLGAVSPCFLAAPTNRTCNIGSSVTFAASAAGTAPISYQWKANGTNISGATSTSLVLTNVQMQNAGAYSLTASNVAGVTQSSNATLTVNFPPAVIRTPAMTAASANVFALPVLLVANGNENSAALSLYYDPTKFKYVGTSAGTVPGAFIVPQTTMTNTGRLGLSVALPPGVTFTAGTQVLAQVNFLPTVLLTATSTSIGFGDQPTARQLLDSQLNVLSAFYTGSIISISAVDYEADLFPLPSGDRALNLGDWLIVGRYAARLDYPTNAIQFQKADCAPRSSGGDGSIRVTDWVQAGRYAFGLDPLAILGGPTNEVSVPPAAPSATRILSASSATLSSQQACAVAVTLSAQGNENAIGFSLSFDPARVSYIGANLVGEATNATLYANNVQAASGQVGFVLALPPGSSFSSGSKQLLSLSLLAGTGVSGPFSPVFGDLPVPREISDVSASALEASYAVLPPPPIPQPLLQVSLAGTNVFLAWPLWAYNFVLEETGAIAARGAWSNVVTTPVITNNGFSVTLPRKTEPKYFRLKQ